MSKCRAHVQIMDFLWHNALMNLNGCCRSSKRHLFRYSSLSLKNVKLLHESWCGERAGFYMCKMVYLAKATCFSPLSCYACGWLYRSHTKLNSTETLPTLPSLNVILVYSVYSVTALLIEFTVEPSICQILFHSLYFSVLLISDKTLKIQRFK